MGRFRLLLDNFIIYGFGSILHKIIPFLMLPIVTRLMPSPEYFGLNDMLTVTVSIGQAIAVMGMYDAMYRMFFDKQDLQFKKKICSSALGFVTIVSLVLFIGIIIFRKNFSKIFYGSEKYTYMSLISALCILVGSGNTILSAPSKMENKRFTYILTNALSPLLSYTIAIPLLIRGYFTIALPLATLVSSLFIVIIFFWSNRNWFSFHDIHWKYIKEMLYIGLPLFPNFILYWIFNSSDRIMIVHLLDSNKLGLYAIGSKLGQISQIIYTAFASGWLYYSYSTMDDEDQIKMMSHIFEYLGIITYVAGLVIINSSKFIFKWIFPEIYQPAAVIVPYLFLAPLLLMLANVAQSQILIIKKTWISPLILFMGVLVNIIVNFFLIPTMGIEGAAIGTLLAYGVSVIIYVIVLSKMKLLCLSKKFLCNSLIFVLYFIAWRCIMANFKKLNFAVVLIIITVYIVSYLQDLKKCLKEKNIEI